MMDDANNLIKSDLFRYTGDTSLKVFLKQILLNPGFRYSYLLRKYNQSQLKKDKFRQICFFLLKHHYSIKYSIHIPPNTKIGYGLYLGYGENITITGSAVIGNNVNINHGAVIGVTNRGEKKGAPTIGDSVWVGTNAVVVGKIKIGNNALIAPLSHINFDVPDNAVVAGNPGNIISFNGTDDYINNKWNV